MVAYSRIVSARAREGRTRMCSTSERGGDGQMGQKTNSGDGLWIVLRRRGLVLD